MPLSHSSHLASHLVAAAGFLFAWGALAQVPAEPTNVTTITSPDGIQVRFKQPTSCETTPGVNAWSGYIDLDNDTHYYFLFYESRGNSSSDPITLWVNGGPGSDSNLGAYLENGPCYIINDDLKPTNNPFSWNNVSNMLYISEPMGVGFSYSKKAPGSRDALGTYQPPSVNGITGQWPVFDPLVIDTTAKAAVAAWNLIQAFFENLPQFDQRIKSKSCNLWTESYGGHYGPTFYDYFVQQNLAIKNGSTKGVPLTLDSLGVGNGLLDYRVQAPFFLKYSTDNNYGVVAYNQTVHDHGLFELTRKEGCQSQIDFCRTTKGESPSDKTVCAEASDFCRDTVENLFFAFSDIDPYDVRFKSSQATPPMGPLKQYLNRPDIQNELGVSVNWTGSNDEVFYAFQNAGDVVYPSALKGIADLLNRGVKVTLYAGDADYLCNWFGGEAVSLAIDYDHSDQFRSAGYAPFEVNGKTVGDVRQAGGFSFTRIFDSSHQVPFSQPESALALFTRALAGLDIATGKVKATDTYATEGDATSTHKEG